MNPRKMKYENLQHGLFEGVGKYDIPILSSIELKEVPEFVGFNCAKSEKNRKDKGIHFFLDDYHFFGLWNRPCNYLGLLKSYKLVLAPDLSMFSDFPVALQIYNHYRKHWLCNFWSENGIMVIPTICWSDKKSFEWCFDGEPIFSTVAVSSVGTQMGKISKENFLLGYNEMLKILKPKNIIFYGNVPKECKGNIINIPGFQNKFLG